MLQKIHLSLSVTNHLHSEEFLDNTNLLTRYGIRGVGERACEENGVACRTLAQFGLSVED